MLYCFIENTYDVITLLIGLKQKVYNEKKMFQKGKRHSSLL